MLVLLAHVMLQRPKELESVLETQNFVIVLIVASAMLFAALCWAEKR